MSCWKTVILLAATCLAVTAYAANWGGVRFQSFYALGSGGSCLGDGTTATSCLQR